MARQEVYTTVIKLNSEEAKNRLKELEDRVARLKKAKQDAFSAGDSVRRIPRQGSEGRRARDEAIQELNHERQGDTRQPVKCKPRTVGEGSKTSEGTDEGSV